MQRELTFREIRLSSIVQRCCFNASWDIARLENLKRQVLNKEVRNHEARVAAQRCLNNIEHQLTRSAKCLKALQDKDEDTSFFAEQAHKGCVERLSKIQGWYE
jgi:hypothetical protein